MAIFATPRRPLKELFHAAQITTARDALEEAARICDYWAKQNHVYVNGAIQCAKDIRALRDSIQQSDKEK